jgi:sporulation protein YlmC with PRC-barrel domain
MRLDLGSPVNCADGAYGELSDVVIDPSTRRVTHLVVQPHHRHDQARLVPIDRAGSGSDDDPAISLQSTVAEVDALEPISKSAYLRLGEFPVEDPNWQVGIQEIFALPYYESLSPEGLGTSMQALDYDPHATVNYDRVPKDEIEIRRGSAVTSSDGDHLGHVEGFVVDDEQKIARIVMEHGHLWGKKDVAIPIGTVARISNDEVVLSLSTDEVGKLKSHGVHRWGH